MQLKSNHLQTSITMKKYTSLYKLTMSKIINESVKRAVRERLKLFLAEEERRFNFFEDNIKHKVNLTRAKQVRRESSKRMQALKIVIHLLTPYYERGDDVPAIVIKKKLPPRK